MGYATGQFGKNHLGDLNEFLPTVHGFDEFFGYLYHLDAMEDPCASQLPAGAQGHGRPAQHGPFVGDGHATTPPNSRAGARSASNGSRTPATLYPKRMETVDDEILDNDAEVHRQGAQRQEAVLRLAQSDAHARRHASFRQVRVDAQLGERLEHPGSRHGAARRCRRLGHEVPERQRPRRQHDRRLHHRQRRRELHLAGWRPDAVRRRQGHRPRGRLPRAGDRPLARQGAGWQGRERHRLRARLVPDPRRRGRQPEHRRRVQGREEDRRPDLQGPSRRLRPDST